MSYTENLRNICSNKKETNRPTDWAKKKKKIIPIYGPTVLYPLPYGLVQTF